MKNKKVLTIILLSLTMTLFEGCQSLIGTGLTHHHVFEDCTIEPTCIEYGISHRISCKECGYILLEGKLIEPMGHLEKYIGGVEPTCQNEGRADLVVCERCGEIIDRNRQLPMVSHSYICDDYDNNEIINHIKCKYCAKQPDIMENKKYQGNLTNNSKFVSIGFDDFRQSDFDIIIPIYNKHNARATFNHIVSDVEPSESDISKINTVLLNGHQLGDHTFLHLNWPYDNPMMNGQNPNSIEGNQTPFPSNDELRNDAGGGYNIFGLPLDESCAVKAGMAHIYNNWGNLSDEECQKIRDTFSLYSPNNSLIDMLDQLSNRYLGTTGHSYGSYDNDKECYTGGIFTGAKTSNNYEVWNKILALTKIYYIANYGVDVTTWSWPGDPSIYRFTYLNDEHYYYDLGFTKLANYFAKFPITDKDGNTSYSSFNDCLRKYGFTNTHDTTFPGRNDGQTTPSMAKQLFFNASYSRPDAVPFRTDSSINYLLPGTEYNDDFFSEGMSDREMAKKMYEYEGSFYDMLEATRHDTANGLIHGEIIDSEYTNSTIRFFEYYLDFCDVNHIESITKDEAIDICFNKILSVGNLIHNPYLDNSVKNYIPEVENLPSNPDGYIGDCEVIDENGENVLHTFDETIYKQYGIPPGIINYSANVRGNGEISFYVIKNGDDIDSDIHNFECVGNISVSNYESTPISKDLKIPNNPLLDYNERCGGYDDKIICLVVCYSDGLFVKDINLSMIN